MTRPLVALFLIMLLPLSSTLADRVPVLVGGYPSRPYVNTGFDGKGVTVDLIKLFNDYQSEYRFVFSAISSKRRYQHLRDQEVDLLMFEDPSWGWQDQSVLFSKPFMIDGRDYQDAELYVALKSQAQDQSYFDDLKAKRLLLVRGYHYAFAGYNADEQFLEEEFNAYIVDDQDAVITMLLGQRGEIGLITRSTLNWYTGSNPEDRDKFYIAERVDHVVNPRVVIGTHSPLNKIVFDQMLADLERMGLLERLFRKHHLID